MKALEGLYNEQVIRSMQKQKGHRFIRLMECLENQDEGISVTAWDTKADLDAWEKSGVYEELIRKFGDFYISIVPQPSICHQSPHPNEEKGDEEVVIPATLLHNVGWKTIPENLHLTA